uniref:Uncharacterized protein n=1 Tax=Ascaris lumbricoides TaxID=6252 RepID=A0A0M3HIA2_ASCLU
MYLDTVALIAATNSSQLERQQKVDFQTLTFNCAFSMNNRLANAAWLHIRDEPMCDGASKESTFECCDEPKADKRIDYWTVVMGDERRRQDQCATLSRLISARKQPTASTCDR